MVLRVMDVKLLTLRAAAELIGGVVSTRTLEREIADGRLAVVRIRSKRFVAESEIRRYIAAREERGCQSARSGDAGKSASALETANALSELYLEAPRRRTRGSSKLRSAARRSTLRLVGSRNT